MNYLKFPSHYFNNSYNTTKSGRDIIALSPVMIKLQKAAKKLMLLLQSNNSQPQLSNSIQNLQKGLLYYEEKIFQLVQEAKRENLNDDLILNTYGSKYASLIKQARWLKNLQLPGIAVPSLKGISGEKIRAFLLETQPRIFTLWESLGELFQSYRTHSKNSENSAYFLDRREVQKSLQEISQAIAEAFTKGAVDKLLSKSQLEWLECVKKQGRYLMVRSTGAEDSKETANAGGNISEAYVEPNSETLMQAVAKVVQSYFSPHSLANRINANLNPFAEDLKLAVFAQELIGEPIGGLSNALEIPISLVLFSSEPLYVGKESFRVMRISATYGHGEGVVGNKSIPCDTALLLISEAHPDQLYLLYDNVDKRVRLAPLQTANGVTLGKVANPEELRKQPVLSPDLLARLYHWGIIAEKIFDGTPTDMEIVIQKGMIFSVQARNINRKPLVGEYIDLEKIAQLDRSPIIEDLSGEMIVPGNCSVATASSNDEVLVADTLEEAERNFKKEHHKLVIVHYPEPVNSHPVVNFSGLAIPCTLIEDRERVKEIVDGISKNKSLVFCTQTAGLYLWDVRYGLISDFVKKGFTQHPANIAISIPGAEEVDRAPKNSTITLPLEISRMLIDLRARKSQDVALNVLKRIKEHPWLHQLTVRKIDLKQYLKRGAALPPGVARAYRTLKALDKTVQKALNELEAVLVRQKSEERLKPLFHIKVLHILLTQQAQSGVSLGRYSIMDTEPIYQAAIDLIQYQQKLDHPAYLADMLSIGYQALFPETNHQWAAFLLGMEVAIKRNSVQFSKVEKFKHLMTALRNSDALPSWLLLQFSAWQNLPCEELFDKIVNSVPDGEIVTLKSWMDKLQRIREIKASLHRFADRTGYDAAWQELQDYAMPFMTNARGKFPLENLWQELSPLTSSIAIKVMHELVDTFDQAIKTMKSNSIWTTVEKLGKIKMMLVSYLKLLQAWMNAWVNQSNVRHHASWPITAYLSRLQSIFLSLIHNGNSTENMLLPSRDFSVAAAVWHAGTDLARHLAKTLEDFFTLLHQNLLFVLSQVNQGLHGDAFNSENSLPPVVKKSLTILDKKFLGRPLFLTAVNVERNEIAFNYNVPLRNHSGQLSLRYHADSSSMTFQGRLLGTARERWALNKMIAFLLNEYNLLSLAAPIKQSRQEISLTWKIADSEVLQRALKIYGEMAEASLGTSTKQIKEFCSMLMQKKNPQLVNKIIEYIINHHTSDEPVQQASKQLLIGLLNHDELFIKSVKKITQEQLENSACNFSAWNLLKQAVEQGHLYEFAHEIFEKYALDSEGKFRDPSVCILESLVSKKRNLDTVERVSIDILLSHKESKENYAVAIRLLTSLINLEMAPISYQEVVYHFLSKTIAEKKALYEYCKDDLAYFFVSLFSRNEAYSIISSLIEATGDQGSLRLIHYDGTIGDYCSHLFGSVATLMIIERQLDQVKKVIDHLIGEKKLSLVDNLYQSLLFAKKYSDILKLFDIPGFDSSGYRKYTVLEILISKNRPLEVEKLIEKLEDSTYYHQSLALWSGMLAKNQEWQKIKGIIEKLRGSRFYDTVLKNFSKSLADAELWQDAENAAESITDFEEKYSAFNYLLENLEEKSKISQAEKLQAKVQELESVLFLT